MNLTISASVVSNTYILALFFSLYNLCTNDWVTIDLFNFEYTIGLFKKCLKGYQLCEKWSLLELNG